jgi:hypothetical protein
MVDLLFPSSLFISKILTGLVLFLSSRLTVLPSSFTTSSTYVFHSPQAGHFPIHLGDCEPQFWQKKTDFDFKI